MATMMVDGRDIETRHSLAWITCSLIEITANTAKFAKGMKRAVAHFKRMNRASWKAKWSRRRRGENQQGYFRGIQGCRAIE